MRAFITSSSETSLRYCENGFLVACLCDFTEIFAKCSSLVPYLRMCSMPAWPKTAGIVPEPTLPSVKYAGSPPPAPPSNPALPICSTPTAIAMSYIPAATDMYASRNAVEPVAHAFATLITGIPVWPICCRILCPTIALDCMRFPQANISTSLIEIPASLSARSAACAAELGNGLVGIASKFDHPGSQNINISHLDSSWRPGPKLRSVVKLLARCLAGRLNFCSAGTKKRPRRALRDPWPQRRSPTQPAG